MHELLSTEVLIWTPSLLTSACGKQGILCFLADIFIVQDALQIGTPSSPYHSLNVDFSKSGACVHNATLSTKRVNCGTQSADASSTM